MHNESVHQLALYYQPQQVQLAGAVEYTDCIAAEWEDFSMSVSDVTTIWW